MKYFILAVLIGMSGCVDRGKCLKSHLEMTWNYMFDGQGRITGMYPTYYDFCDLWEYPNGKPENAPK